MTEEGITIIRSHHVSQAAHEGSIHHEEQSISARLAHLSSMLRSIKDSLQFDTFTQRVIDFQLSQTIRDNCFDTDDHTYKRPYPCKVCNCTLNYCTYCFYYFLLYIVT